MQTLDRLTKTRSQRAYRPAFLILLITVFGVTESAYPASVSRNLTVTANVVGSCGVSTSGPELGNSEIIVNRANIAPQLGPILTVACSRGADRNLMISTGSNSASALVQLTPSGDLSKRSVAIQIEASPTKIPTEAAEHDRNSRAKTPANTRDISFGGKLTGRVNLSPDNGSDIVVVTVDF